MATPTQTAVKKIQNLLTDEQGLSVSIAALHQGAELLDPVIPPEQLGQLQAPAELVERSGKVAYPAYQVYVEKVRNKMTEKFRRFSGVVEVVIEVRISQDRIDGLTDQVQFYADTVADVVERGRGCLGDGYYLTGIYETEFDAAKRGGLNYTQAARIRCQVEVNR
jgi:hypothetical protein